jgi:O-antigen/teichoic acid export membrane protein
VKENEKSQTSNSDCTLIFFSQATVLFNSLLKSDGYLKQILFYLPASLFPGFVNFLALAFYTRLLSAEEYGSYAFLVAIIANVKMVGFEWLKLGLFRFYQRAALLGRLSGLIATALVGFAVASIIISILWMSIVSVVSFRSSELSSVFKIGLLFLIAFSLFELILQLNRSAIFPLRYGILSSIRAILSLGIAYLTLEIFQKNAFNLVLALFIGTSIPVAIDLPRWIKNYHPFTIEKQTAINLIKYGLPLTLTSAISMVVSTSDRMLIEYFLGSKACGLYSAGYDLADQTLMTIFMILNLAVYPLLLKTVEQSGIVATGLEMQKYLVLMIGSALPIASLLSYSAQVFSNIALGETFRIAAVEVIPWVMIATFFRGLKVFFFDLAFQIKMRTDMQIWSAVIAGVVNVSLNILWIPRFNVMGAVYASIISHLVALIISIALSRKIFYIKLPIRELSKICVAVFIMILAVSSIAEDGLSNSCLKITVAIVIYISSIWLFNVANSRQLFKISFLFLSKKIIK